MPLLAGLAGATAAQGDSPVTVILETNKGPITVALKPEAAPKTVENFLAYVREGHYDGTIFHRVIPGFVAQGGGFDTAYDRRDTRSPIRNEADNGLSNSRGTLAMARTGDPHSATDQFFINLVDNSPLDHTAPSGRGWGYAVFGEVVDGMEVVDAMAEVPTGSGGPFPSDVPQEPLIIEKATVRQP